MFLQTKYIFFACRYESRFQKVEGGIVGLSQDYNAIEKWAMTARLRGAVHAIFKDICRTQETRNKTKLSRKSKIDSEERVLKIIASMKEYENPFAFGSTINSKLKKYILLLEAFVRSEYLNDILEARVIGKEHLDYFINEQFFEKKISFRGLLKKLNLKMFSSGDKPIAYKKKNETITLKTDVNLFSRLIAVSRDRHIDLQNVLSHELSAVPLALFDPYGDMKKTSKSKLLKEAEITEYSQLTL